MKIPRLTIGTFGSIQPEKLPSITKGADDGLASRFVFAWPPHSAEFAIAREPIRSDHAAQEAFARFADLAPDQDDSGIDPRYLPLSLGAVTALEEFGRQMAELGGEASGLFGSSVGKARGQALRLSCIIEHLWWCAKPGAPEPQGITEPATLSAVALMGRYFLPMAKRVYGDATASDREGALLYLARQIRRRRVPAFNARDLRREINGPVRDAEVMQRACDDLAAEGIIRRAFTRAGRRLGQPAKNYEVNPAFLAGGA